MISSGALDGVWCPRLCRVRATLTLDADLTRILTLTLTLALTLTLTRILTLTLTLTLTPGANSPGSCSTIMSLAQPSARSAPLNPSIHQSINPAHRAPLSPRSKLNLIHRSIGRLLLFISVGLLTATIGAWVTPSRVTELDALGVGSAFFSGRFGSVSGLLLGAILTRPRVRGRVVRLLARVSDHISRSHDDLQESAALAALIGGRSAGKVLAEARAQFRVLLADALTEEDLIDNQDTGFYHKTHEALLGSCHGFVSHSWRDDGRMKLQALHKWRRTLRGRQQVTVWLDKACIDQGNIDASLACLPIFLASCHELLVLAGISYHTRYKLPHKAVVRHGALHVRAPYWRRDA